MEFFKYQGAGNDFIIVDLRKKQESLVEKLLKPCVIADLEWGLTVS